ncbi:MAG: hypothetical protein RIK87_13435 [Fuerstiella sp.]
MSQSVQDRSVPPPMTAAPGPQSRPPADSAVSEDAENDHGTLRQYLLTATAVGYYLSMLLHLLGYAVAAILFAYLSQVLYDDEPLTPIRASLDDFDREAEQPEFQVVTDISLGTSDGDSSIERISNNLQVVEHGLVQTLNNDTLPSLLKDDDNPDDQSGAGDFLFKLPESGLAVTKGSFTVWTEPEAPNPQQPYFIIIEIMLPESTRMYRVNDLSGYVVGSDRYRQKIPVDRETPNASFYTDEHQKLKKLTASEQIKVRGNKVQLAIKVPGARRLVKDTIQIRSRRLRENQELELVFGGQP